MARENLVKFSSDDSEMVSIRNANGVAYIEIIDGDLHTSGFVGENAYTSLVSLLKGLQGFGITIDDIFY